MDCIAGEGFSPESLQIVLTHEFVHVRQHILTLKCVGRVLEDLFWYNPLIYIFNRRLDFWSEMACDMECCRDSENVFLSDSIFVQHLNCLRKRPVLSNFRFHVWGAESFTGAYPPDEAVPKTKRDETTGCFGKFYSGFLGSICFTCGAGVGTQKAVQKIYAKTVQQKK